MQSMAASRFVGPFFEKVQKWEKSLSHISEVVDVSWHVEVECMVVMENYIPSSLSSASLFCRLTTDCHKQHTYVRTCTYSRTHARTHTHTPTLMHAHTHTYTLMPYTHTHTHTPYSFIIRRMLLYLRR